MYSDGLTVVVLVDKRMKRKNAISPGTSCIVDVRMSGAKRHTTEVTRGLTRRERMYLRLRRAQLLYHRRRDDPR